MERNSSQLFSRENKGITLIALIIMIIVLLILARGNNINNNRAKQINVKCKTNRDEK